MGHFAESRAREGVLALTGSGCEVAQEAVEYLVGRGHKAGIIRVRGVGQDRGRVGAGAGASKGTIDWMKGV